MQKNTNWKILEEKDISPSKWFPLFAHKVELPNGKIIEDYYISKLGDGAIVVAITEDKKIIFVRQYKHGVQEMTLELPAGRVDNKTPEEAAKDELRQETGFIADKLISLGKVFIAPSKDSTVVHGFLLENAKIKEKQDLDENESIEVVFVPIEELDKRIISGEILTADTIAMLAIAKLIKPELFR